MKLGMKLEKLIIFSLVRILFVIKPTLSTKLLLNYFKRKGMKINGRPNYLSAKTWFDGTDYSLIELNEGCTISSNVRILTHDWSIYTVGRAMGIEFTKPVGIFREVKIGKYAFVGTNSVLMPGCTIGEGAIVGAGSTVRGDVEAWTIVAGSPAVPVGDSRNYVAKQLNRLGHSDLLESCKVAIPDTD